MTCSAWPSTGNSGRRRIPGWCSTSGRGLLEVSGHAAGPPGRSVMIWIQVRDVHAEHARLAAAGVPIVLEPIAEPWGLIEMWIEDPDGIRIVLVEVPAGHPLRRDLRPMLPPGRSTGCRITARPTETRQPTARPECRSGCRLARVFSSVAGSELAITARTGCGETRPPTRIS